MIGTQARIGCPPLRKSTRSGNTNCVLSVICRCHGGRIGDTKQPGIELAVSMAAHVAFIEAVTSGRIGR